VKKCGRLVFANGRVIIALRQLFASNCPRALRRYKLWFQCRLRYQPRVRWSRNARPSLPQPVASYGSQCTDRCSKVGRCIVFALLLCAAKAKKQGSLLALLLHWSVCRELSGCLSRQALKFTFVMPRVCSSCAFDRGGALYSTRKVRKHKKNIRNSAAV